MNKKRTMGAQASCTTCSMCSEMFHSLSMQHLRVDNLSDNLSLLKNGGSWQVRRSTAHGSKCSVGQLLTLLFVLSPISPTPAPCGPGRKRPGGRVSDCQHMVSLQAGGERLSHVACQVPVCQPTPALTFKGLMPAWRSKKRRPCCLNGGTPWRYITKAS